MKITYKELQSNLKDLRSASVNIQCKLSSSKVALEACYLNLIREGLVKDLREVDLSATDLRGANLRSVNLRDANLSGAYLRGADLSDANLRGVNLKGADLTDAYLRESDLKGANLSDAYLSDADLSNTYLTDANLKNAYLKDADLSDADLRGAYLGNVDLSDVDLCDADLRHAILKHANLRGVTTKGAILINADLTGAIGYKPVTQEAINLVLKVAEIVTADKDKLKMEIVHSCDSAHCAAGWICVLDPEARDLEVELGWNVAACTVCPIPEFTGLFYSSNGEMLNFLTKTLEDGGQSLREKYLV